MEKVKDLPKLPELPESLELPKARFCSYCGAVLIAYYGHVCLACGKESKQPDDVI